MATQNSITVYDIHTAKDEKFNPDTAVKLIRQIIGDQRESFGFRISASPSQKVAFQILEFDTNNKRQGINIGVKGLYPRADIDTFPYSPIPFDPKNTKSHLILPLVHSGGTPPQGAWYLLTPSPSDTKGMMVANVAHSMAQAADKGATVQLNIFVDGQYQPDHVTRQRLTEQATLGIDVHANSKSSFGVLGDVVGALLSPEPIGPRRILNDWDAKALPKIQSHEMMGVIIVLEIAAPTPEIVTSVSTAIQQHLNNAEFKNQQLCTFTVTDEIRSAHKIKTISNQSDLDRFSLASFINYLDNHESLLQKYTSVLIPNEIAALFHLPFVGMDERLIDFASGNKPAKAIFENRDGIEIGTANKQAVRLPDRSRYDHINIIGKTGVGKSTLMLDMVRQDIARGKGVGVIDPDGKLVNDILKTAVPDNRIDDVIVLDLAETKYPAPLNPLNIRDSNGQITSGLFADMVRRIYPEFDKAERARSFLMGTLGALNLVNNPTIADAVKLFEDQEFLIETISGKESKLDKGTYRFWASYAGLTRANKRDYPYPVIHRLNSLISLDVLNPILCHPKTLDWNKAMRDNRIILVSLNPHSDAVGDQEQSLLGTIVLSMILSTARNHGEVKPFDFYLYIDEVQRFINTPLDKFFEGIRKFGVYLTVANQFLGQLETGVLEAIIGNVGGTFVFEVGDSDAGKLERATAPAFDRAQLMNLGKFHPVLRMKIDSQSYPAFDLQTKPPVKIADEAAASAKAIDIRRRSIERWTPTTRDSIIEELDKRHSQAPIVFDSGDADDRGRRPKAKKPDSPIPDDVKPETKKDDVEDWDKWADDAKA